MGERKIKDVIYHKNKQQTKHTSNLLSLRGICILSWI